MLYPSQIQFRIEDKGERSLIHLHLDLRIDDRICESLFPVFIFQVLSILHRERALARDVAKFT